jgi:MFS family permease
MLSEVVPLSQRGALLGANTAFQTTAGLIAPLLMGWMLDGAASPAAGFQQGFLLAGGLALAGGVAGLLLLRPETDACRLGSTNVLAEAASTVGGR